MRLPAVFATLALFAAAGCGSPSEEEECASGVITTYADADGDGVGDTDDTKESCGAVPGGRSAQSGDCDDDDPGIMPGAPESCDGKDNDCNGQIDDGLPTLDLYVDSDGDGFGDGTQPTQACGESAGYSSDATDCDDSDPTLSPGAAEICDGIDNDCDQRIDDADNNTDPAGMSDWYRDNDGDGSGGPDSMTRCDQPQGTTPDPGDCDDNNANVHPAATEICNGTDDNCDALVDDDDPGVDPLTFRTWYLDADNDTFGWNLVMAQSCAAPSGYVANNGDCDDADFMVSPAQPETSCNLIDDDCDPVTLDITDADGDGHDVCVDCNDGDASISPTGQEICSGIDEDCDGLIDDADPDVDPLSQAEWYWDDDLDGYGDPAQTLLGCEQPLGYADNGDDCDDADPAANLLTDWLDDLDGDGYGAGPAVGNGCYPAAPDAVRADIGVDCDDAEVLESPGGVEVCEDGFDNDCDGTDASCIPACERQGWKFGSDPNWACPAGMRMPTILEWTAVEPCIEAGDWGMFNFYNDVAISVGGCDCKWNNNWCGQPSIETIREGRMCGDYEQLHICLAQ